MGPVVAANSGGTDLLAPTADADTFADRRVLLVDYALVLNDVPGVGVDEVRAPVPHRGLPGQDVLTEHGWQHHEGRLFIQGWPGARPLFEHAESLVRRQARRRIDVEPLVDSPEDGDGHAGGELAGDPAASDRDAEVVLGQVLVDATLQPGVRQP